MFHRLNLGRLRLLPKISLVVTTYNWPSALKCVLSAVSQQTYSNFEVIVADDGSDERTKDCIQRYQKDFPVPLQHVWQEDKGFRAAMVRNRAIAKAKNEYIVFIDGDCVPSSHFLERHATLAQKGWFVAGNRMLLSQDFTRKVLDARLPISSWHDGRWVLAWMRGACNRAFLNLSLPLGPLRKLRPSRWRGVKTCNLGVWRKDLLLVNGLDESYVGWGCEDTDLALRLQNNGVHCLNGRGATTIIHLWHPENERVMLEANLNRLKETFAEKPLLAKKGLNQYLYAK